MTCPTEPSTQRTCPGRRGERRDRVCDQPIPDTAIRCPGCIARMAVDLRGGANLWPELAATVRRLTKMTAVATPTARAPRPVEGPLCRVEDECAHTSCFRILMSTIVADRVAVEEPPIPNEDVTPVNLNALEVAWSAENTFGAWARVVEKAFGVPIPSEPPRPRTVIAAPPPAANPNAAKREYCTLTDLEVAPIQMCGCPTHRKAQR